MPLDRNIWNLELDRLQEVLDYDPETGHLTWRIRTGPMCKFGQPAGGVSRVHGYRKIAIDGKYYMASHLAWFHFYGTVPEAGQVIDFINRDRDDTRIENLRLATSSEDARNRLLKSHPNGLKGVSKFNSDKNLKKFRSTIRVNGKRIHLGQFATPEEAHAAYREKVKELHGEFGLVE